MTDHQTNQTFRAIICSCNNADKPNTVLRSRQILNYQNMSKQFLFSILTAGVLATSCNQVTEKAKEETQNQSVISFLFKSLPAGIKISKPKSNNNT